MFNSPIDKEIQNGLKSQSKIISIVIRNAMEDFHSKHLSDEQMKELNPIIRNAVYTALYTMQYCNDSVRAREFIDEQIKMIPRYWEEPKLIVEMGE
jgi:transcription termination factor NusB